MTASASLFQFANDIIRFGSGLETGFFLCRVQILVHDKRSRLAQPCGGQYHSTLPVSFSIRHFSSLSPRLHHVEIGFGGAI